jgi:hypothetical protein
MWMIFLLIAVLTAFGLSDRPATARMHLWALLAVSTLVVIDAVLSQRG